MVRWLIVRWFVVGTAFAVTAALLPGMEITGGVFGYLWIALVFGVVNAIIGAGLRTFKVPQASAALGLFSIVVNALLLAIVDNRSSALAIDGDLGGVHRLARVRRHRHGDQFPLPRRDRRASGAVLRGRGAT